MNKEASLWSNLLHLSTDRANHVSAVRSFQTAFQGKNVSIKYTISTAPTQWDAVRNAQQELEKARDLAETHKAFQERMESSDEGNYMTLEGKLTPDEVGQRIRAMREQLLAEMAASEHHA